MPDNPQDDPYAAALRRVRANQVAPADSTSVASRQASASDDPYDAALRAERAKPGALGSIAAGLAQGASLGFGDEAYGAVAGALPALFRGRFGEIADRYAEARDAARRYNRDAREAHPWLYGGSELAAGIAPALLGGAEAAGAKAGIGALMKTGAKIGAIAGFGNAEGDVGHQVAGTVVGAGVGALGGAAAKGLSAAGKRLAETAPGRALLARLGRPPSEIPAAERESLARIANRFGLDEVDLPALEQRAQDAMSTGKPIVLADLGEDNVKQLVRKIGDAPGEGQRRLAEVLKGRIGDRSLLEQSPAAERTTGDVANLLGVAPEDIHATERDLIVRRAADADRLYGAARARGAVDLPIVNETFADPDYGPIFRKAHEIGLRNARMRGEQLPTLPAPDAEPGPATQMLARAREIMQRTGRTDIDLAPLEAAAADEAAQTGVPRPTVASLHRMKEGLDAIIQGKVDKVSPIDREQAGLLNNRLRQILDALEQDVPEYRTARQTFAGESDLIDALRAGRDEYPKMRGELIAHDVGDMSDGERALARRGFYDDLVQRIARRADHLDPVTPVAGNEVARGQLRALAPSEDAFTAGMRRLEWERRMRETLDALRGGSNTSRNLAGAADEGITAQDVARAGGDAARGRGLAAVYDLAVRRPVSRAWNRMQAGRNARDAEVLLSTPNSDLVRRLVMARDAENAPAPVQNLIARLLGADAAAPSSRLVAH